MIANRLDVEIEQAIARKKEFFAIPLPPLRGSAAQIDWAESIRLDAVAIAWQLGVPPNEWEQILANHLQAKWWIDRRNKSPERTQLRHAIWCASPGNDFV